MPKNEKGNLLLQYTATIATSITGVGFICSYCWPSPSLPYLTSEKSEFLVTQDQGSWIASLYPVGLIIGYLLNPLFVDRIGRKRTLLIFSLPQMASWLLIILANNYIDLYIARIIGGIGYGGGLSCATVYISEIGDLKNRGVFLVFLRIMLSLGFLFTMLLGAFLSYNNMNLVLLMLPIIFLILFFFMPDSNYFLDINKKNEREIMMKLYPISEEEEMKEFISEIKDNIETKNCDNNNDKNNDKNFDMKKNIDTYIINNVNEKNLEFSKSMKNSKNWNFYIKKNILWKLIAISNHRKSLEITLIMGLTNILSGHAGMTAFTQQIFTYKESFLAPEKATVVLAITTLIFSIISILIIEKINRKIILLSSGLIASISLAFVGIFFFLKDNEIVIKYFEWLPIVGITIYDVMLSCGMGNLFYIYQGELFANDIKNEAIAVNKISYMALSSLFLLKFQNFIDNMGTYTSFWCFSVGTLVGTLCVYIITPETKGKRLQEIQDMLKSREIFI